MNTQTAPVILSSLAAQVARNLPGSWTVDPVSEGFGNCNQYLTRASDGLKLFFAGSSGGWAAKGKLRISFSRQRENGSYIELYEKGNKVLNPEIGMSETKTPEQIAQSIVSRLLPLAEQVFAKVNEKIRVNNDAEKAKAKTVAKIGHATGAEVRGREANCFYVGNFDFEVRGGNCVAIKTYGTDAETALAIAELLKTRQEKVADKIKSEQVGTVEK